jgi:diguanylate cyclase (GGDEF)-like protein
LRWVSKQYVDRSLASVRQLRQLNDQLSHQAYHDPLTGLVNRVHLTLKVQDALERAARSNGLISVLFIDLDNFKAVNDSLGHSAGDKLLMQVAERLRACLRRLDTPARLGGDEFAVLLEELDGISEAVRISERMLGALRAPFILDEKEVFVNASIGIAASHPTQTDPEELLRNADVAMYAAKERGKGCYVLFEDRLHVAVLQRLALETDLRFAVERDQLVLHFQPIFDLANDRIDGFEALVRWNHPERGMIPPGEFIPLAESSGLIVPIGKWVVAQACQQLKALEMRCGTDRRLHMALNVSPRQLLDPTLIQDVSDALAAADIAPHQLVLEITEGVLMQDVHASAQRLAELKTLGVRLAIDDFGTGYSSLSYLRRFPVDILKIDQSFVRGIGTESEDTVLTEAIVTLARALHLQIVAEGIETSAQLAYLRRLGCDQGQGYLLGRPQPIERVELLLRRQLPAAA